MEKTMRLATCKEWDRFVEATGGNDEIMHWDKMFSWCDDVSYDPTCRKARGYYSARRQSNTFMPLRNAALGFRPTIDIPDVLEPDGSKIIMGTLCVNGSPVKVPQQATWDGDITSYALGARLELKEALEDPAYQVVGVKVGHMLIADRVMLKNISWNDIRVAIRKEAAPVRIDPEGKTMRMLTCEEWDRLAEITSENSEIMHWKRMFSWCDGASLEDDPVDPRMVGCGYYWPCYRTDPPASHQDIFAGFRPAIDIPGVLGTDGARIVMGTLYMGGQPVKVPQHPTWNGDITSYVSSAKLELREAMDDPAYQLMGIKGGSVLVADRVMLKRFSWVDVQDAIGNY